jgi:hypothetical protein
MSVHSEPQQLWSQDPFSVSKVVLESRNSLTGAELGEGVIYLRSPRQLIQQISAAEITGQGTPEIVHPSPSGPRPRYIWNPGEMVDLVNVGRTPIDLLHVGFSDRSARQEIPLRDFSLFVSYFLNGDWHDDFKESVRDDIQLIGGLARRLASGQPPTKTQIDKARYAREDLEFKVRWFLRASRRSPRPRGPAVAHSYAFDMGSAFGLLTGKEKTPDEQNGLIGVTVHTRTSAGGEDPNWRVHADPRAHQGESGWRKTFVRLSTPTTRYLPVCRYWLWAEKELEKIKSGGIVIEVGIDDDKPLIVDLVVS